MQSRAIAAALAVGAVVWFALVLLAPVLPPWLAAITYAAGGVVCHQRPERSFHWHGAQLAVCSRCTGIYLGACVLAIAAAQPRWLPARWLSGRAHVGALLAAAAAPVAITVASEWAGWWVPSPIVRAVTGVIAGVAAALVVAAALGALHYDECLPPAARAPRPPQTPI